MGLFKRKESSYKISSMQRTRIPVFHRFWGAAILASLFIGFPLGSWVWSVLNGIVDNTMLYDELRAIHLTVQVFVFFGLFVAGFALQSGAHVLGGSPPKSEQVIWIYPLILLGVLLRVIPSANIQIAGNVLITAGNLWLLFVMLRTALGGDKTRLVPIASLFVIGFLVLATAPWLDLSDASQGFFVLWSGIFLIVLAAGQQLIANVLSAKRFNRLGGMLFALTTLASVVALGLTVFAGLNLLQVAGILMALTVVSYIGFLGVIPALIKTGFTSLVIAFVFNFFWALVIAFSLIFADPAWDAIVHILALGSITTMIIAVGARVLGFFSGKGALSEGALTILIIGWQLVPLFRGGGQILDFRSVFFIFWLELLFSLWAILCFRRVLKVMNPDKAEE
ncbi:MAG: NnrS family protein [Proteobacteria bacterium]|nr:NnrS family protein [Pseudomonadota bacterium]